MSHYRFFQIGMVCSLSIHLLAIGFLSRNNTLLKPKPRKQIEVVYTQIPSQKSAPQIEKSDQQVKVVEKFSPPKKIHIPTRSSDDFITMQEKQTPKLAKFSGKLRLDKKNIPKITPKESKSKVSIPLLKSEKISNPRYLSYNQMIRQKIKQEAYRFIDDSHFKSGRVYLTFIVNADGKVQRIQIVESKTQANGYLRDIGRQSIERASPFPPFPKDLNFPELTFNVVISFEVEDNL